jgi:hypothetical protein
MMTVTVIARRSCSSACLAAHWLMVNQDGNVQHGRVTHAVQTTDGCSQEICCAGWERRKRERVATAAGAAGHALLLRAVARMPATVRMGWGPGQVYSPDGPVINRTQLKHGT